ncbi:MAG: flagellar protein FlgN [Nitrospirae bacterium]|nr:flagellar protein FlgN [Candidatus Manganitrophaceae bacterium]
MNLSVLITPQFRLSEVETLGLLDTLEHLLQEHQTLLFILQEEKRLIVEGKIEGLLSRVNEKEAVMRRIAGLEQERIGMTDRLEGQKQRPSLKTLILHVVPIYRAKLNGLRKKLEVLTTSITEINQMNGILVERVLTQISDLFTLLGHLTSDGETYQGSGKMSKQLMSRTISRG